MNAAILFTFLLVLANVNLLGAGMSVIFNTRIYQIVDAPVSRPDGTGAGAGAFAQLFIVRQDKTLVALNPKTAFRTNLPAASFYVQATQVDVPGVQRGETITLRMRAWEGADWDSAKLRGESNDFQITYNSFVQSLAGMKPFKLEAVKK